MSENGHEGPLSGELRPARPRRLSGADEAVSSTSWDVIARVEELHEVVWSIVDTVAVVRDGLTSLTREVGALQGTLGTETHEHVFFRETMNRQLNAIRETLEGEAATHRAALTAVAETPALVTGTHEIKALLTGLVATTADLSDQIVSRFDDVLLTLREQAAAQSAALGEAASRMTAVEDELSAMRRAADRERRSTTREIQSLRAEVHAVVESLPQELPQPKKTVTARRSAAARKQSPAAAVATTAPVKRERRARKPA